MNKPLFPIGLIFLSLLFITACSDNENLYEKEWNLSGDLGVHDPVIIFEDGTWHIFFTGVGIRTKTSEDGLVWKDGKKVFPDRPEWYKDYVPRARQSIWAPDIFRYENKFYLFYSLSSFGKNTSAIGVAVNSTLDQDNPKYHWEDLGPVVWSEEKDDFNAIDPNVIQAVDGSVWLSFGSFWSGIKLIQLDPETMMPVDRTKMISLAYRPGENDVEAPFLIYRDGYYYLFVSHGYCCRGVESTYHIVVGRSEKIEGPYLDQSGKSLMEGGGTVIKKCSERWKGPGHCAVYQSEDSAILVYHAYDAENNGDAFLQIDPLFWDEQGWPLPE